MKSLFDFACAHFWQPVYYLIAVFFLKMCFVFKENPSGHVRGFQKKPDDERSKKYAVPDRLVGRALSSR